MHDMRQYNICIHCARLDDLLPRRTTHTGATEGSADFPAFDGAMGSVKMLSSEGSWTYSTEVVSYRPEVSGVPLISETLT